MTADKKTVIKVCMGSSCFVRGNAQNLSYIEDFIKTNNLNAKVEIVGHRCENKCSAGPHVVIEEKSYKNVSREQLEKALHEINLVKH